VLLRTRHRQQEVNDSMGMSSPEFPFNVMVLAVLWHRLSTWHVSPRRALKSIIAALARHDSVGHLLAKG
jgi:hypothetical protein